MTQEQIIDNEILNLLEKKVAGSKELILRHTTKSSRRLAMLSILDDNRKLLEEYKNIIRDEQYCSQYATDVVQLLRKYVKVADVEKKKHGEVMTPIKLVNEMLDTLPSYVWSNKDLKWLDPCNGVGTFSSVIVERLMIGLKDVIFDDCERYRHIIENMLYVCDIQAKNMFLFHCAFDREDNHELNTYYGSFLDKGFDDHMKNAWGVEKFDIVIGNPPYNTGTSGGNGARDLWDKFVFKGFELLKDDGFLVYVHPSKWRSPENKIFDLFKKNNLIYLEIHNDNDGRKVFGASTRYDFYLLQKSNYNGNTKVIDELGNEINVNICEWDWLPNYNFELIKSIMVGNEKCEVIYSASIYDARKDWMSSEQSNVNYLPCVYGMYEDGTHSYKYSSIDKGHFGIPKVIISGGRYPYPYNDFTGNLGMTNNAFALKVNTNEEAEEIKVALNSENFSQILKATKWSNFQINYKMFKSFRKDFYKQFLND